MKRNTIMESLIDVAVKWQNQLKKKDVIARKAAQ